VAAQARRCHRSTRPGTTSSREGQGSSASRLWGQQAGDWRPERSPASRATQGAKAGGGPPGGVVGCQCPGSVKIKAGCRLPRRPLPCQAGWHQRKSQRRGAAQIEHRRPADVALAEDVAVSTPGPLVLLADQALAGMNTSSTWRANDQRLLRTGVDGVEIAAAGHWRQPATARRTWSSAAQDPALVTTAGVGLPTRQTRRIRRIAARETARWAGASEEAAAA